MNANSAVEAGLELHVKFRSTIFEQLQEETQYLNNCHNIMDVDGWKWKCIKEIQPQWYACLQFRLRTALFMDMYLSF